jgi:hypothetical protein
VRLEENVAHGKVAKESLEFAFAHVWYQISYASVGNLRGFERRVPI